MAKFDIETVERHEMRVTYRGVEATDEETAKTLVREGRVAYDAKEPTESDEFVCFNSVERVG